MPHWQLRLQLPLEEWLSIIVYTERTRVTSLILYICDCWHRLYYCALLASCIN